MTELHPQQGARHKISPNEPSKKKSHSIQVWIEEYNRREMAAFFLFSGGFFLSKKRKVARHHFLPGDSCVQSKEAGNAKTPSCTGGREGR